MPFTNAVIAVPEAEDLIGFDTFANQLLRKQKGEKDYFEPHYTFLQQWLSEYGELTQQQAAKKISDLQAQEKAMHQARHKIVQEQHNKKF